VTWFWASFDVVSVLSLALLFRSVVRTEMGEFSKPPKAPHETGQQPDAQAAPTGITASK